MIMVSKKHHFREERVGFFFVNFSYWRLRCWWRQRRGRRWRWVSKMKRKVKSLDPRDRSDDPDDDGDGILGDDDDDDDDDNQEDGRRQEMWHPGVVWSRRVAQADAIMPVKKQHCCYCCSLLLLLLTWRRALGAPHGWEWLEFFVSFTVRTRQRIHRIVFLRMCGASYRYRASLRNVGYRDIIRYFFQCDAERSRRLESIHGPDGHEEET